MELDKRSLRWMLSNVSVDIKDSAASPVEKKWLVCSINRIRAQLDFGMGVESVSGMLSSVSVDIKESAASPLEKKWLVYSINDISREFYCQIELASNGNCDKLAEFDSLDSKLFSSDGAVAEQTPEGEAPF